MGKRGRRLKAGEQIAQMAASSGVTAGLPHAPIAVAKGTQKVLNESAAMADALLLRNARQRALLNRASELMKVAVDECHCGGVERAITKQGYAKPTGGDTDAEAGAPDAEGG